MNQEELPLMISCWRFESWTTIGYTLPATGYTLPATSYILPATGYTLPHMDERMNGDTG